MAESSGVGERPSPSRSWFAASRVEERVRDLEANMELVHLYCFATAPRDIQRNSMAIDNLTSRLDGANKFATDNVELLNAQITSLRESHAPQNTEPSQAGESQQRAADRTDPLPAKSSACISHVTHLSP